MARSTVDFGIDLGTTNSAIAMLVGTEAQIIKNAAQRDTTPSAVYVDRHGRIHVGDRARERVEHDVDNTAAEFKLQMGQRGSEKRFRDGQLTMTPESLSAEVLRRLKADAQARTGEDIQAAVITVPAAFDLNQCDATRRAARDAGLAHAPLLQEPTAAALAYGFQRDEDNIYRLVFDFGGGTFDAAVVHVRDGEFDIVNHEGDNFLGGKLIDWAIVEQLLIPPLLAQHPLTGFARGNPRWAAAIARLKRAAEEAKITLSTAAAATVELDDPPLCVDDRGQPVEFVHDLRRDEVERLTDPFAARAVNICQKALRDAKLAPRDIDRVLLVGGPTLMPYLRERVSEGLGISVDITQDPMTVVARGAAIFAGTQRLDAAVPAPAVAGAYTVELEYSPIGADPEPQVGGIVRGPAGASLAGFTIEFANAAARPPWRSGKIPLSAAGGFITALSAAPGVRNEFAILLEDSTGRSQQVEPDSLPYTIGTVAPEAALTHSVGIALEGNKVVWLLTKGSRIPGRGSDVLRTTVALSRGQSGGLLRIPVLEGEYDRADRNRHVGDLEILASQVRRDLPVNTEVEVTIEIDASRIVATRAYVPLLDEEFETQLDLRAESAPNAGELRGAVRAEQVRRRELEDAARQADDAESLARLAELDNERVAEQLEDDLAAYSNGDADAAGTAAKRLLDLQARLDQVERALAWPRATRDAEELLAQAPRVVEEFADRGDRRRYELLVSDLRAAMGSSDVELLRTRTDELRGFLMVLFNKKTGGLDVARFEALKEHRGSMRDQALATRLFEDGERALESGNLDRLRNVVRQLIDLLPRTEGSDDPFGHFRR
ncbi:MULTISPECIES: Hsp70 family protein [unclassified Pseudofrankia]|uniref:Hsp70 family protein n=1 Tax=unclassified Pseudofrankia TaxID=2994372 RepID=UPI0008DA1F60|nr:MULTISPECIES: Hsp70 family protein [unclassified Pseudofrankia]MDT3438451.1 Hsp70 family protein [Pseudofrankia sp. BMG5.37]OHV45423.1 2-alkenal reductase [Pseudofrankia sp. BMG5.36]